jgi:predicted ATP-grasp superfamily ATP-dependent carboligase
VKNILITGGGCPGWYSTYRLLLETPVGCDSTVFSCDVLRHTVGSSIAHKSFVVPRGDDAMFIDVLLEHVSRFQIGLIIPLTDPELLPLSRNHHRLQSLRCDVLVSPPGALESTLDKDVLYERLPHLSPAVLANIQDLDTLQSFIAEKSDGASCFIKLTSAHGSRGTKKVVSDDVWLGGFRTKKPEDFGLTFPASHVRDLLVDHEIIALETLPGTEYSIDCVYDTQHTLVFYGVREREAIRNGICSTAKFVVDTNSEFLDFVQAIGEVVKFRFNVNIQAKRDRHGVLKLLEINPRISGSLESFGTVGHNLLGMSLTLLSGRLAIDLTPRHYSAQRSFRLSHFVSGN